MANDQTRQTGGQQADPAASPPPDNAQAQQGAQPLDEFDDFDGLEGKKPDELTPEELRLMADTMPGEGPGD
jgi:hypothetical protein